LSKLSRSRRVGSLQLSALGVGCAGMSNLYGPADETLSADAINAALDLGITVLDTAASYGPPAHPEGHNERLVGRAVEGRRDEATLVTKVGVHLGSDFQPRVDARPEVIRASCDESLTRLQTEAIDLYILHRVDPTVPVEDSVGALADLVTAGKVRAIGLSEVSGDVLKRAATIHPISAIESEWSLWSRDIETTVLKDARSMGIGILAYAPLGRGFLAGAVRSRRDLAEKDLRGTLPRFEEQQIEKNLIRLAGIEEITDRLGCTLAQLALAWVLAQGDDVVPIPGMERPELVRENVGATDVSLSAEDLARLNTLFPVGGDYGGRYSEGHAKLAATSD
jgi:aryl-alcohol dehydrogenase-like predicted oxidoreductase